MDDVSQNIRDDRHEPHRPTRSDMKEWATETLIEGEDDPTDLDGFRAVLSEVADRYEGHFTEEEFRDLCREAFWTGFNRAVGDEETDLDGATHRTLDSFEGDEARLAFDSALVDALLDGRKNATVRYDLEPGRLEPGTRVHIVTSGDDRKGPVAVAYVEDVIRTTLGDALDAVEDAGYQHNTESVADLWRDLNQYYEDALELSTEVAVVLLDDVTEVPA